MTNEVEKAKKTEETFSIHIKQRHEDLNRLEAETGQYKEDVSSLKSQLEEAKKQS